MTGVNIYKINNGYLFLTQNKEKKISSYCQEKNNLFIWRNLFSKKWYNDYFKNLIFVYPNDKLEVFSLLIEQNHLPSVFSIEEIEKMDFLLDSYKLDFLKKIIKNNLLHYNNTDELLEKITFKYDTFAIHKRDFYQYLVEYKKIPSFFIKQFEAMKLPFEIDKFELLKKIINNKNYGDNFFDLDECSKIKLSSDDTKKLFALFLRKKLLIIMIFIHFFLKDLMGIKSKIKKVKVN